MSPSHTLLSIIASAVSKLDIHPRRVWNGKLPIAYLPSEILILIFLCAQDAALPRQKGHTALALSWVSHHWRVVALSSQDLWGTIDFRNPEWARASLSRSGVSPLSIFLKETREELTPTLTLILTEHFRVKTLRLEAQLPGFQRIPLDELWSQPTPHMTDLLLDNFIIPDGHLISTAPALRHLELRACVFDVSGLHGFNLVKLSLCQLKESFTVEDILTQLENLPELEELDLEEVMNEGTATRSKRLPLPRLQVLTTLCNCRSLLCLLDSISFPEDIRLTIFTEGTTNTSSVFTAIRNCHGGDRWKLESAAVHCDAFFASFHVSRILPSGESRLANIGCFWDDSGEVPGAHQVNDILASFDMTPLITLGLSSHLDDLPSELWAALLDITFGLQMLAVHGGYSKSLINMLVPHDSLSSMPMNPGLDVPNELSQRPNFPSLQVLELQRVPDDFDQEDSGPTDWPGDAAAFARFMHLRKGLGFMPKLSTMTIVGYDLPKEIVQNLELSVDGFQYRDSKECVE